MSGGFQGPFERVTQGSASDDAAKAPDPLGPSGNSSPTARDREASLFWAENGPLPIVLFPQMPLEACHEPPFPNAVWPRVDDWEESLLCRPGAAPNSGNRVDRTALVMAAEGLLVVADMSATTVKIYCSVKGGRRGKKRCWSLRRKRYSKDVLYMPDCSTDDCCNQRIVLFDRW